MLFKIYDGFNYPKNDVSLEEETKGNYFMEFTIDDWELLYYSPYEKSEYAFFYSLREFISREYRKLSWKSLTREEKKGIYKAIKDIASFYWDDWKIKDDLFIRLVY